MSLALAFLPLCGYADQWQRKTKQNRTEYQIKTFYTKMKMLYKPAIGRITESCPVLPCINVEKQQGNQARSKYLKTGRAICYIKVFAMNNSKF